MTYLLGFGLAFALAAGLTPLVRRFAVARGIIDRPNEARKIHGRPVAYLGGAAIFLAFIVTILSVGWSVSGFWSPPRQLLGLLAGCTILVVVGVIDDARGLSPWTKLVWQFVAAGVALTGGIGITTITNPFGGVIDLTWGRFGVDLFGLHFNVTPVANALSLLWMVGLANTINFLDGLDGLACGVSGIAAVIIFALAVGPDVRQPAVALIAIALAGAAFGFLPYNFHPARIFMGDAGAYFLGLTLAMLSIYSGAKLATAALVLGFPIADAIWAAVRRILKRQSPFRADRKHFHHLMLDAGLTQRQAAVTMYGLATLFGTVALVGDTTAKVVAFGALVVVMGAGIWMLSLIAARRQATASVRS